MVMASRGAAWRGATGPGTRAAGYWDCDSMKGRHMSRSENALMEKVRHIQCQGGSATRRLTQGIDFVEQLVAWKNRAPKTSVQNRTRRKIWTIVRRKNNRSSDGFDDEGGGVVASVVLHGVKDELLGGIMIVVR